MDKKKKVYAFSAKWCGPCKTYKPVFDATMADYPGMESRYIDIDEESELTSEHKIRSVPTTIVFADDVEVFRETGTLDEVDLAKAIENHG